MYRRRQMSGNRRYHDPHHSSKKLDNHVGSRLRQQAPGNNLTGRLDSISPIQYRGRESIGKFPTTMSGRTAFKSSRVWEMAAVHHGLPH